MVAPQMHILPAFHVWFVLQAQNGSLERNFAHKRRMDDRLKGNWTPKCVDERLRVQCNGKDPLRLARADTGGSIWHDDLIVAAAADSTPKERQSPNKRQLPLAEVIACGSGQRKQRTDRGGTHKTRVAADDHAAGEISEQSARDAEHVVFQAPCGSVASTSEPPPITLDEI